MIKIQMLRLMKRGCRLLAAAVVLQGCGIAYVSPRVVPIDDTVIVHQLTNDTLEIANQTRYVPRSIPAAFSQTVSNRQLTEPRLPTLGAAPQPTQAAARIPPNVDPGPYVIGVGDVVQLGTKFPGGGADHLTGLLAAQSNRQGYTVQDDGTISVPDVGHVSLAGSTLEQAEAQLFQSFVAAGIDPTFNLEIAEFNAARVVLGGAVATPVVIPITLTPLYLNEALTRAGGTGDANPNYTSIRMYRDEALYQIPLTQYLADPSLQKLRLLPGDSIYVDVSYSLDDAQAFFEKQIAMTQLRHQSRTHALSALASEIDLQRAALSERRSTFQDRLSLDAVARDYVYLTGEVSVPGRFTLPFEQHATLADALFAEGGFANMTANPSQIYVLRGDESGTVTVWQLDGSNVANMVLATRMVMQPNDIIFVAEQPVTRWHRVVQQIVPSLITSGAGLAAN